MKPQKPKATQRKKLNPAIEALTNDSALRGTEFFKTDNKPCAKASAALNALFLQAQGLEWRDRYAVASSDVKPVPGGDQAALLKYAALVREHVAKLNSLPATCRDLLLPFSKKCFSWPGLIGKRRVFGDDPDELIRQFQVGSSSIANDSAARFDPTRTFGKVAWKLIERIELRRAVSGYYFHTPPSWENATKSLPPFDRKASPDDKRMWLAVVEAVLKDDFCNPDQAAKYLNLITAPSHRKRKKAVFFDKVRGEFNSLWGFHRKGK